MSEKPSKRKGEETFGGSAVDSLKEFLEAVDRGEPITVRRMKLNLEPRRYTAGDAKATREKLQLSQAMFAQLLGVSVKAVEAWESGRNKIPGPLCRLLEDMNLDPRAFLLRHLGARSTKTAGTKPARA